MYTPKAFLFDLDGVLVDTAHFHYMAWRELANQLGFDFSVRQNEALKGIGRMESLDIVLKAGQIVAGEAERNAYAARKNAAYLELCSHITPADLLPGVLSFLKEVKAAGIPIGLGSVSKNAPLIMERLEIAPLFDTIVDGNRITRGKPDPEVFLLGAADLNVAPAGCVVFEDAVAGIQAAKNAGMRAIGVGDPALLQEADQVIPGFDGLTLEEVLSYEF